MKKIPASVITSAIEDVEKKYDTYLDILNYCRSGLLMDIIPLLESMPLCGDMCENDLTIVVDGISLMVDDVELVEKGTEVLVHCSNDSIVVGKLTLKLSELGIEEKLDIANGIVRNYQRLKK